LSLVDLAQVTALPLRSLSRWENGGSIPNVRSAALLVVAYLKLDANIAHELAAAMDIPLDPSEGRAPPPVPAPPVPAPAAPTPALGIEAFELSTLLAADALNVPASRLRAALAKLVPLWRAAGLTLESVQQRLAANGADDRPAS
jgi:hypothetical protein